MHVEPWGGVLAAGAHVRTVRTCRILASHVARLAGQIVHEGGRVEQSKSGRATVSARPHDGMPSRRTARMVAAKRLEGLLEAPSKIGRASSRERVEGAEGVVPRPN